MFTAVALASIGLALTTAAWASVTGDPSEFNLCPINFTPPAGASLLCSHSETTGGTLTIGNSTVTISNNHDTVDLGAYNTSGLGLFGVAVIVTPTNGQVFGGPAQVVPGGLLGVSVAGYNGLFTVTAIPSGTTFQYTTASGLTAGSGGTAAADTSACGLVDQGAAMIPSDGGKVLLAGGDLVTFLGQSSNLSFIFDPATQTFARTTGSLTTQRELFALVAMDPAVVTGPLSGRVVAFGGIDANSDSCTTASANVVATTLNSAEVFDPGTQTWTAAANTMGVKRAGVATLFEAGSLAGESILPGGVDVEAGTLPSTCAGTANIKQAAQSETDLYDPSTGAGGTFTATGSLNQAREGAGQGVVGAGTDSTDLLILGGACTTPTPSLQSVPIGTSQAATTCGSTNAQNDYSELYSQSTRLWTVGPTFASGFTPTNAPASAVLP
jgi:hypothetical protein